MPHRFTGLLLAAGAAAVAVAAFARHRAASDDAHAERVAPGRPFEPRHALSYVAIVAAILLLAAIVHERLGDAGLAIAAGVSGFADVHAAAASVAQLVATTRIAADDAALPVTIALIANSATKFGMAWLRGGSAYALRVLPGLAAIAVAFAAALWLR